MTDKAKGAGASVKKDGDKRKKSTAGDDVADEGFKSTAAGRVAAEPGSEVEEIAVEDLAEGLANLLGDGVAGVVDKAKSAWSDTGVFSTVQSAARTAVSGLVGGIVKVCDVVNKKAGAGDAGFRDKSPS